MKVLNSSVVEDDSEEAHLYNQKSNFPSSVGKTEKENFDRQQNVRSEGTSHETEKAMTADDDIKVRKGFNRWLYGRKEGIVFLDELLGFDDESVFHYADSFCVGDCFTS